MQIWLDTAPAGSAPLSKGDYDARDCPNECPDECGHKVSHSERYNFPLTSDDTDTLFIRTGTFEHCASLYTQRASKESWLVCNPVESGQIAVLDAEAFALLEQFRTPASLRSIQDKPNCPSGSVEAGVALLYKLGFLCDIQSPSFGAREREAQTLTVWLHISNACNLRCDYCYIQKTSDYMAEDTAQKAIDAIFRSATRHHFKYVHLQYAGGEASLHIARVIALHDYANELAQQHGIHLQARILSNGVVLSQRTIDSLKGRNIDIMISLDGIGKYHDSQRPFINGQGSFKYVDRTINRLLENDLIPHISITVSRRNLPGLPDLMKYILERRLPFTINYYRDIEASMGINDLQFEEKQMIATMQSVFKVIERNLPTRCLLGSLLDKANLRSVHHNTCGVGRNYLVIDQNGGIAKCQADIKRTVTTIAADDPLTSIRNDRSGVQGYSVDEKETCRTCEWRYWCTGGCPLLTYRMTGRNDIKSPNCNIYKALFPRVLHLEAQRLLSYMHPITF